MLPDASIDGSKVMTSERFPGLLAPIPENIPDALKKLPQWIVWQTEYDHKKEKWTKEPRQSRFPNARASKSNRWHWSSFDTAYSSYLNHDFLGGVGFITTKDDPFMFFDMDKCIVDGKIDNDAMDVVYSIGSYAERSPSGKGVRIVALGKLPGKQINNQAIKRELYDGQEDSFLTISGHVFTDQFEILPAQDAINKYHSLWLTSSSIKEKTVIEFSEYFIDDIDLSRLSQFTLSIIEGNYDSYPSRSEALYGVVLDMLSAGYSNDEILSVITDDSYAISEVAASRRPNNRESQRMWIANYTLKKALSEHNETKVFIQSREAIAELIESTNNKKSSIKSSIPYFKIPSVIPVKRLQEMSNWMSGLSEKPTPAISTAGAIALGSVLTGRMYRSTRANWTSLLMAVSGSSGVGKNYIKVGIERALQKAELINLITGDFYTHQTAVYCELRKKPCHICISDEFGENFMEARKNNNANKLTVFKSFKKAYSDADHFYKPESFSDIKNKGEIDTSPVFNPSLTLLGLTTPLQFYSEIKVSHIESGLINRFIIVNIEDGQQTRRSFGEPNPPEDLITWMKLVRHVDKPSFCTAHNHYPTPIVVKFSRQAESLFDQAEIYEEHIANSLAGDHLDSMARRLRESSMRLATSWAGCDNYDNPIISEEIAHEAINYVFGNGMQTIDKLKSGTGENDYQTSMNTVLNYIQSCENGITDSELSRRFRSIKRKERSEIMAHLQDSELIYGELIDNGTGARGRKAMTWMAL